MQTYSHFIVAGALKGRLGRLWAGKLPPLHTRALLLGAVLPDLPLIGLSILAIGHDLLTGVFRDPAFAANTPGAPPPPELIDASLTMKLFEVWFFENPWVIAAQNLFHSPLLLICFIFAGLIAHRRGRRWGATFFWLSLSMMLHTLADIPLHVTDGPLLLFPLNWTLRYQSPISYWDPNYFGREWSVFEHLLDLVLLGYLFWRYRPLLATWWRRRRLGKRGQTRKAV